MVVARVSFHAALPKLAGYLAYRIKVQKRQAVAQDACRPCSFAIHDLPHSLAGNLKFAAGLSHAVYLTIGLNGSSPDGQPKQPAFAFHAAYYPDI